MVVDSNLDEEPEPELGPSLANDDLDGTPAIDPSHAGAELSELVKNGIKGSQ